MTCNLGAAVVALFRFLRGANMIPQQQIDEIRRLLAAGRLSRNQIAETVGVSRGTVQAVALGRRLDNHAMPGHLRHERRPENIEVPETFPPVRDHTGGLTYLPQIVREAREAAERHRDKILEGDADPEARPPAGEYFPLELTANQRARYERLRALKEAEGEPPSDASAPE